MHSAPSCRSSTEGRSSDRPRREAIRLRGVTEVSPKSETLGKIISHSRSFKIYGQHGPLDILSKHVQLTREGDGATMEGCFSIFECFFLGERGRGNAEIRFTSLTISLSLSFEIKRTKECSTMI